MTIGNKISDFISYWCKFKCPYRDVKIIDENDPVDVCVEDYKADCVCPKCGEEFTQTIDGTEIDYETDIFPAQGLESYCEYCQVKKFAEELKFELG